MFAVRSSRSFSYVYRSGVICDGCDTRENRLPITAASSTAIAAPCAWYGCEKEE